MSDKTFVSLDKKLVPSPWMCYRTWVFNDESITILADELNHEIATLEGPSSKLWHLIETGIFYDELVVFAARMEISDELYDFVEMLLDKGYIKIDEPLTDKIFHASPAPVPKPLEFASNTEIESEVMKWVADRGFLYNVHWEVTYRCNEKCVHCYNPGAAHLPHEVPERQTDELSHDEAIRLFDEMKAAGVFRITLSGGEVTLRNDFWELVEAARSRGFSVNIYTNGLHLDTKACERLSQLWPSSVSVSVYSDDPLTHDKITNVKGSFERSINALKILNELGIKTFLKSTQMSHTINGYQKVKNLAATLGAAAEIDMTMSSSVDGSDAPLSLANFRPEELVLLAATPDSPLFVGDQSNNYGYVQKDFDATVCGAGISTMSIDPEGNITPCASMPLPTGSFRRDGFLNIWRSSKQFRSAQNQSKPENDFVRFSDSVKVLSSWQEIRLRDYSECGTHRRCGWCNKCPGLAMLEHGDLLGPSTTNCRMASARMIAADLIMNGNSREEIARILNVSSTFGVMNPGPLPVMKESVRGSGFDSKSVALNVMHDCGSCNSKSGCQSLASSSYKNLLGNETLRNGTTSTREVIQAFENLADNLGLKGDS